VTLTIWKVLWKTQGKGHGNSPAEPAPHNGPAACDSLRTWAKVQEKLVLTLQLANTSDLNDLESTLLL
jgi:hypothetical protein